MAPPAVDWSLPYQTLMKKMPHRLIYRPIWLVTFSQLRSHLSRRPWLVSSWQKPASALGSAVLCGAHALQSLWPVLYGQKFILFAGHTCCYFSSMLFSQECLGHTEMSPSGKEYSSLSHPSSIFIKPFPSPTHEIERFCLALLMTSSNSHIHHKNWEFTHIGNICFWRLQKDALLLSWC